jgi:hypothetical protein
MLVGNWARFQVQCLGVMAERVIDVEQTTLRRSLQGFHLPHPARQSVPTAAVQVHNPFPFAISARPTAIPHDGEGRRRTHSTDEDSDTLPCGPPRVIHSPAGLSLEISHPRL